VDNWESLSRSLAARRSNSSSPTSASSRPTRTSRRARCARGAVFFCRPGHPLLAKDSLSTNDMFDYPLASTRIPPGFAAGQPQRQADLQANIQTEHFPPLVKVAQTEAIGGAPKKACARRWPAANWRCCTAQPAAEHRRPERPLRHRQPHRLPLVGGGAALIETLVRWTAKGSARWPERPRRPLPPVAGLGGWARS
jgi:hypothetical protein